MEATRSFENACWSGGPLKPGVGLNADSSTPQMFTRHRLVLTVTSRLSLCLGDSSAISKLARAILSPSAAITAARS